MNTQWHSKALSSSKDTLSDQDGAPLDEHVVILMQGKNTFGDRVYSYLKITLGDLKRMQSAVLSRQTFNPSDFGTIIAAGKGEPTDEVKAEINAMYKTIEPSQLTKPTPDTPPPEEKAWDEF